MARILLSGLSSSLAHAGRLVRLAQQLQVLGNELTLAGGPGFFADPILLEPGSFPIRSVWEPTLESVLNTRGPRAVSREIETLERALSDDDSLLDELRPQAVIADNRRSLLLAAARRGIPSVSLTNASLLGPLCAFRPTVEQFTRVCAPILGMPTELARASTPFKGRDPQERMALGRIPLHERLQERLSTWGIQDRSWVHELCLGDLTLVLDSPLLFPVVAQKNLHATGPILPVIHAELPSWWQEIPTDRPLVYLTGGSTGNLELLRGIAQELHAGGMEIILGTTGQPAQDPGVRSVGFIPGEEISQRARLVVCHGGSTTIYQALACGTPVLCIAEHMEQAMNALSVEDQGAGRALSLAQALSDPERLKLIIREMAEDSTCQEAARRLSTQLQPQASLMEAALAITVHLRGA